MTEPTAQFPSAEVAASAQLAPYRLRLLAFVLDASMLVVVLVVGGLASVLGQYALDFGVSVLSIALLALAVFIGFGVMNAMLAYLTDGQTVGKAYFGLVERRRATRPDLGDASGLVRLMGRHTIGYLVIDVFGLGALATFRLARRRCLHDVVFDTEVTYIGGPQDRLERVKALDVRRQAALEDLRERWGWAHRLLKWGSGVVIAVVTAVIGLFKAIGVLSAEAPSESSPAVGATPAAPAPTAAGVVAIAAATAAATVLTPVAVTNVTTSIDSGGDVVTVDGDEGEADDRQERPGTDEGDPPSAANPPAEAWDACAILTAIDLQRHDPFPVTDSRGNPLPQEDWAVEPRPAEDGSLCSTGKVAPGQYFMSVGRGDYEELAGTADGQVVPLDHPGVDRGEVALAEIRQITEPPACVGCEVTFGAKYRDVSMLLELDGQVVSFLGPLVEPYDYNAVLESLLAVTAG